MINKDRIISASKPSMGALSFPHQNLTHDRLLTFLSLFFSRKISQVQGSCYSSHNYASSPDPFTCGDDKPTLEPTLKEFVT